jgi:hypothetical protein
MLMRFREVLDHVREHLPNVAIGNAVEHLLALPPRLQEPSGPQKTQVMGDQRLAEPEPGGISPTLSGPSRQLATIESLFGSPSRRNISARALV